MNVFLWCNKNKIKMSIIEAIYFSNTRGKIRLNYHYSVYLLQQLKLQSHSFLVSGGIIMIHLHARKKSRSGTESRHWGGKDGNVLLCSEFESDDKPPF